MSVDTKIKWRWIGLKILKSEFSYRFTVKISADESTQEFLKIFYLDNCISGQTNSNTSLVGNALIFSDLRAGMDSSKTQPRRGKRSLVLTKTRYIHWSLPSFSGSILRGWRKAWFSLPPVKGGTFSRRSEMATAPRFSSMPNQFWWSEK